MKPRLPDWFRQTSPFQSSGASESYAKVKSSVQGLATVCQEAKCPNIAECWSGGTATVMLLGEECTRGCRFCAVRTNRTPTLPDASEGEKLAESIAQWKELKYLVLTSVSRDDLADQGSRHIALAVRTVKDKFPGLLVEALVPDFQGDTACVDRVAAEVDVYSHNLETVERLQRSVRDRRANYNQSLTVLARAALIKPAKSSLMLGLGESVEEVQQALKDLRTAGVSFLTLGQYLQPTKRHMPVHRFVPPEEFDQLKEYAKGLGFRHVASGPRVRSSYRAADLAELLSIH